MLLICYGTRPEIIKLAPVIRELLAQSIPFKSLFTGQHSTLYHQFKDLIPDPDYFIETPSGLSLNASMGNMLLKIDPILKSNQFKLMIVQGDTASAYVCSLAAFNQSIRIGHVEAGLRTNDLSSPFPEEGYRQMISRIAAFNWAPTINSLINLERENIFTGSVTGNTIVDQCISYQLPIIYSDKVLVTLHRRENFGERMKKLFMELERLATLHPELEIIFPMHPNPHVQMQRPILSKVKVTEPIEYDAMIKLISEVKFVISDSGGIQEECASFRKKILVCRNTTERPEGIEAGFAKLIDTDILNNYSWALNDPAWNGQNPYGDGQASKRIVTQIKGYLAV